MRVNWLAFNHEDNICKCGVVYYSSHISYQAVHCLVINFIFLKLADIQNADIVKPFTTIEPSEYEQLFGAYDTSCVPLPTSRCFFKFQRMAPSHCFCIQNIQIVGWNYLFERSSTTIVSTEKINLITDQVSCMTPQSLWWTSTNLWLGPAQRLGIKYM